MALSIPLASQARAARAALPEDLSRYDGVAITLHWLIALALLAQLSLGWWMLDVPKSPPGLRAGWFNCHKSIGITLGALIALRLVWRPLHRAPALPAAVPRWQRLIAGANHFALYVCMVVMPLSGYLGSAFTKYPVRYFGMELPKWAAAWPAGKELMSTAHHTTAWLFMSLIALHLAGAAWHLVHRDTLGFRMWPQAKKNSNRPQQG